MRVDLKLSYNGTMEELDPYWDLKFLYDTHIFVYEKIKGFLKRVRTETYQQVVRRGIQSLAEGRL